MAAPALVRHVEDRFPELADLFSAGEDVRSLMAHPGWAHVQALIECEVNAILQRLESVGSPVTHAEYAMAHGRLGGLRSLRGAAEAILERAAKRHAEQKAKHESPAESGQEG